jgi:hypothetical protein
VILQPKKLRIMKKLLLNIGLMLSLVIGLTGCYKDVIKPELAVDPEGPPQQVSFSTELAPMFETSCALAGCHVSGSHKPYLKASESYNQITGGGFVNTSFPKLSIFYTAVYGEMSQYLPSAAKKQKVYDWIRNGAPNN